MAVLSLGVGSACSDRSAPAGGIPTLESGGVNPCLQRVASWQALQATINGAGPAERLTQLRAAAQEIGADPEACTADLIDSAMADELRKVLLLEASGRRFPAAVVYSCAQLRDGTQCSGRTTDDTANLGEFPDVDAALPAAGRADVVTLRDYPIAGLQWYRALDSALLDSPAAAVTLTPQPDGTLELPKADEANLLFAIGRGPAGELHKWVWIVRAGSPAGRPTAVPPVATAKPEPSRAAAK